MALASLPDEVLKLILHYVPLKDRLSSCCLVSQRLHAAALAATQQVVLGSHSEGVSNQQEDCFKAWMPQYGQHLTHLELWCLSQPLQQLACPNLLHLKLWKCSVQLGPTADGHPGVMQACTKLTHLNLVCNIIGAAEGAVLHCLSSLVHLEHLNLRPWDAQYESCQPLQGLCSNTLPCLTKLTFLHVHNLSYENLAQLGGLTSLQELHLAGADDDVALGPITVPGMVLPASLTKLTLRLPVEAGILSLAPTTLQDLQVCEYVEGPAEGPGSLLSYLSGLQHLVRLWVDPEAAGWPPAGPAYSAVTASSSLVSLWMSQNKLPRDVWSHVFPATRKLLHLTSFCFVDYPDVILGLPATWIANDLSCLVSCCPKLCKLSGITMQHGCHVSYLSKVTGLTSLKVLYADAGAAALEGSMGWLAAVKKLQDLSITLEDQDVTVACLLPLTRLTALTKLTCYFRDEERDSLCNLTQQDSSKPDVWLQLVQHCAADWDSQPLTVRSLAQQLAEQTTKAAEQGALVARQQQQLWDQQQVVAEQGARIAVLEGHLQALLQRFPPV